MRVLGFPLLEISFVRYIAEEQAEWVISLSLFMNYRFAARSKVERAESRVNFFSFFAILDPSFLSLLSVLHVLRMI